MRVPHLAPPLALLAFCLSLIASGRPASAQEAPAKLDPLLRRLVDPAVAQAVEAVPQLEEMGRGAGFPAAQLLDFTRPRPAAGTFVTVFVSLTDRAPEVIEAAGGIVGARMGSLFTARVPISALTGLAADPRVRYVRASVRAELENDLAMADIRADQVRTRSGTEFTGATGRGVILGFVDSGIDFAHDDFRNADGSTRILYIWDQTGFGTPPGDVGGQVFSTGNECDAAEINAGTCSQRDTFGHGSHVAGIAAGDGSATGGGQPAFQFTGVAPHAEIVMVKTTLTIAAIIEGIQYIFKRAEELGRPAVVNLSVGSQFSSHDGTDPWEHALDSLSGPGRIITVSAGNDGSNQNSITSQPPLNYIHATRALTSGDTAQITLTVPSYSPDPNGFDFAAFTMWYDGRDTVTVTVTRPNGTSFSRRTGQPDGFTDNAQGAIFIDNASQGAASQNGDHELYAEIVDNTASQPPAAGTWRFTVRLDHRGGNGRFDLWMWVTNIESSTGEVPRFTGGGDNAYNVSAPGNAALAITVGAHTSRTTWNSQGGNGIRFRFHSQAGDLTTFSSSGPTRPLRDEPARQKPDLSAPGSAIFSARSASISPDPLLIALDGVHMISAGTSMSAPMAAGAVALLLERNPALTPELVQMILHTSARQDGFTTRSFAGFGGGTPNPSWGYGKLDVEQALALVPTQLTVSPGPATGTMGGAFVLPRADVPSVQIRVVGSETDDIRITGLRLRSDGSGNDGTGVAEVRLYADADSNGAIDAGDTFLATAPVAGDDGEADLTGLDFVIPAGGLGYLLAAYSLNGTPAHGDTFRLSLETPANVTAERAADLTPITLTGSPVAGDVVQAQAVGTLTVATAGELPAAIVAPGQTDAVLLRVVAQMDSTESFDLRRLVATLGGTADPATTVRNLRMWHDENRNGVPDTGDDPGPTLATDVTGPTIAVDLASVGFVGTFENRHWLVLADIPTGATPGASISVTLDSLTGFGITTDSAITAVGPPIAGPAVDVVRTTVTSSGPVVDSATVLRNATALPLARVRFETLGERVIVDSLVFRMSGTLAPQGLSNLRLFADLDSSGSQDAQEPALEAGLRVATGGRILVTPNDARLEPGTVWWVLAGDGADNAAWGQTFQVRLDSTDFYARGEASGQAPQKQGATTVTGRLYTIGGRAALTVAAGPEPPRGPAVIGPNPVLQWSVAATTLEGAHLDSVFVEISGVAPTVVDRLELYVDSSSAGVIPSYAAVVAIADPFAAGNAVRLGGFSVPLDAGASLVLLFAGRVTDRLRQGDSLAVRVTGVAATGQQSGQPAQVTILGPASSALARATLLEPGETFLLSENPVRSGRVIFSYGPTPRAVSLYTFAGLRVRHFTNLPANRYEWDVRAETPGLPNGMYVLIVDTGEAMLRRRLMILSPRR